MTNCNNITTHDSNEKVTLNLEEIKKYLQHREPFLFISEVKDIEGDQRGTGIFKLTGKEDFFKGHFPNNPICPGVLILEAMAQTAGVIGCRSICVEGSLMLFGAIDEVKFKNSAYPGDTIEIRVEKIFKRLNIWKYKGVATVGDKVIAVAIMTAVHVDDPNANKR
jgi:3-hydroxyacyl-[acyl-carrier-protein] dehydratase